MDDASSNSSGPSALRFGGFELSVKTGELRKAGVLVNLAKMVLRAFPDWWDMEAGARAQAQHDVTGQPAGSLAMARAYTTVTLLADGTVLVAGGTGTGAVASAEIYDPATGTFSSTGSLATARFFPSPFASVYASPKIL